MYLTNNNKTVYNLVLYSKEVRHTFITNRLGR